MRAARGGEAGGFVPARPWDGRAAVSLFSGALGLDVGLGRALPGMRLAGCVEADPWAAETARSNFPDAAVLRGDIGALDPVEARRALGLPTPDAGPRSGGVFLVSGGLPCQPFAYAGRRRGVEDPRGGLVHAFAEWVAALRPDFAVFENVRAVLSALGARDRARGGLWREVCGILAGAGYAVDAFVANAANHGAPQARERVVAIANRLGLSVAWPRPSHGPLAPGGAPYRTLRDAVGGMPADPDPSGVLDFSPRKKAYLDLVPPGGNWRSLPVDLQRESMGAAFHRRGGRSGWWRRLAWDRPAPTLVTMPNHASTSLCHPDRTRALSLAECAALQGFPEGWRFEGPLAARYRQVGNAVPVALGEAAGRAIADALARGEPRRGGAAPTETRVLSLVRVNRYKSPVRPAADGGRGAAVRQRAAYRAAGSSASAPGGDPTASRTAAGTGACAPGITAGGGGTPMAAAAAATAAA